MIRLVDLKIEKRNKEDRIPFLVNGVFASGEVVKIVGSASTQEYQFELLKLLSGIKTSNALFVGDVCINSTKARLAFAGNTQSILAPTGKNGIDAVLKPILYLSAISKRWNGNNISVPSLQWMELLKESKAKMAKLNEATQKQIQLCRLICCNAKVWVINQANLYNYGNNILKQMIISKAQSGGIIFFTTTNTEKNANFLDDITSQQIVLKES